MIESLALAGVGPDAFSPSEREHQTHPHYAPRGCANNAASRDPTAFLGPTPAEAAVAATRRKPLWRERWG